MKDLPHRRAERLPDGNWKVTVTPPAWSGFKQGSSVILTHHQYGRYLAWLQSQHTIQSMLPELTAGQRETLMSGIPEAEFDEAYPDDDEGE